MAKKKAAAPAVFTSAQVEFIRDLEGHLIRSHSAVEALFPGMFRAQKHSDRFKGTYDREGRPVESVEGVADLTILHTLCDREGLTWTPMMGRGSEGREMFASLAKAHPELRSEQTQA